MVTQAAPTAGALAGPGDVIVRVKRLQERDMNGTWRHKKCYRCREVRSTHMIAKWFPDADGQPVYVLVDAGCLSEWEGQALERGVFMRVPLASSPG